MKLYAPFAFHLAAAFHVWWPQRRWSKHFAVLIYPVQWKFKQSTADKSFYICATFSDMSFPRRKFSENVMHLIDYYLKQQEPPPLFFLLWFPVSACIKPLSVITESGVFPCSEDFAKHITAFTIFLLGRDQGREIINLFLPVISLSPFWRVGLKSPLVFSLPPFPPALFSLHHASSSVSRFFLPGPAASISVIRCCKV